MDVGALRFDIGIVSAGPVRCRIDVGDAERFTRSIGGPRPAAFVIRHDEFERVLLRDALAGVVIARGVKHPAKGLSTLLLGSDGIPAIRGRYRAVGQLNRSIRTLLRNAKAAGERQAFLIGVDAGLYDTLWAGSLERRSSSSRGMMAGRAPATGRRVSGDGSDPVLDLLELLADLPVPGELVERFVGESPGAQLVRQLILRAARTAEPVLILGDTGTGKEVVARSIHEYGPRSAERFTAVNCGAIPGELLESELFGHVRGAFTSAIGSKEGLWKVAGRGTLFLDEIGDLRLDHQAKILRALQEGTVRPVGGRDEVRVHARVVAATNRDLYRMVRAGEFRADLYFRLRSFLIRTPRLRDHPEDIPALALYFWRAVTGDPAARLPAPVLSSMRERPWPGNARELRAVLAHLNSLFPDEEPRVEFLNAVFELQGQDVDVETTQRMRRRIRRLRGRDALLRLEDVLSACRATLQPLGRRGGLDGDGALLREALRHRLEELRSLVDDGFDTTTEDARTVPTELLDATRGFRRGVVELAAELEVDPAAAARHWRGTLRPALGRLLDSVEAAISALDRG